MIESLVKLLKAIREFDSIIENLCGAFGEYCEGVVKCKKCPFFNTKNLDELIQQLEVKSE